MTLTPQQRLKAYEWARECVLDPFGNHIGVCTGLQEYLGYSMSIHFCTTDELPNYFPEFLAQKPKKVKGLFWWSSLDERLAALDRAIELVKEKI